MPNDRLKNGKSGILAPAAPQAGHEHVGHRPALVLTPARYNRTHGMLLVCPSTSKIKGYPFEVAISIDPPGSVLANQVKSLDRWARKARRMGAARAETLEEVRVKIRSLVQL
ncbi:MAG: type II toxin-antitoxin system PemK/MazF family toxin [Caulobacteraceae bacterium]